MYGGPKADPLITAEVEYPPSSTRLNPVIASIAIGATPDENIGQSEGMLGAISELYLPIFPVMVLTTGLTTVAIPVSANTV